MKDTFPSHLRTRFAPSKPLRDRSLIVIVSILIFSVFTAIVFLRWTLFTRIFVRSGHRITRNDFHYVSPLFRSQVVPCRGARGLDLGVSQDDEIVEVVLDGDNPQPYLGSYAELGLRHTWSDADGRWGPYGRNEDSPDNPRKKVDWNNVDWAELQNECLVRNMRPEIIKSQPVPLLSASRKLRFPEKEPLFTTQARRPPRAKITTGRTAIILRGWTLFEFGQEDLWHIRALITETALRSGGRYAVILLVDVKDEELDVMNNPEHYEQVLRTIPAELRDMTVLFDQDHLLKAWYPKVEEYSIFYQVEQARQVFAHLYDEFDHYWQVEMDVRFTGHAGDLLDAIDKFSRAEPRKQARERASFHFISDIYGTYSNFTCAVNSSLHGGSSFWRGLPIPDVAAVGPTPPVPHAEQDNFSWGVGEDADVVLLNAIANNTMSQTWAFHDWILGFSNADAAQRILTAPAINRCSWNLLNEIHQAQVIQGLRIPSEATPPSFALWHNMKISMPPMPKYAQRQNEDAFSVKDLSIFLNGGLPNPDHDGMSFGQLAYGDQAAQEEMKMDRNVLKPTYAWTSPYPRQLMNVWLDNDLEAVDKDYKTLVVRDGHVLVPNLMLHPVKK